MCERENNSTIRKGANIRDAFSEVCAEKNVLCPEAIRIHAEDKT